MGLRWAELAWDNRTRVVHLRGCAGTSTVTHTTTWHVVGSDCHALFQELLDHDAKFFVVTDQFVQLVLIQIATHRLRQ